ncbi:MAG: hypothetical protein K1X31_04610 [Gemmatimonadaceae bacterium]|nr:hypothetical protein [Gemmatimonadaceae bacterium]
MRSCPALLRLGALVGAALGALAAAPLAAQDAPKPDAPCGPPGYLFAVEAPDFADADSAWLAGAARALAYRWPVPSKRRDSYANWRRVRRRILPPEPRWADDYEPAPGLRARFTIVLTRRGRPRISDPAPASGDELFDHSLRAIITDPLPASPDLPGVPAGLDSLVLVVHLGAVPDTVRAGVVHFATGQRRVEPMPGALQFEVPRSAETAMRNGRYATVKYDVSAGGQVIASSVEILDSSDREIVDAVRGALVNARFRPAEQGCRAVAMTVVQVFRT